MPRAKKIKVEKTIKPETQEAEHPQDTVTTSSPVPAKKITMLDFYDALREAMNGKRLTRVSWEDNTTFILMYQQFLYINMSGKLHQLIVAAGDIEALDWFVLPEPGLQEKETKHD